jgi:hypothetical protein
MKPYSKDLRLRVLSAVDRGVPREEVAKTFSVSVPTIKQLVRKAGACAREELVEAIGRALAAVTPDDAASWFTHACYRPQDQSL